MPAQAHTHALHVSARDLGRVLVWRSVVVKWMALLTERDTKVDSVLRDINREQGKMQSAIGRLNSHYEQMAGYVRQYIEQTTVEWAKLIVSHPKALLLVVETTRILDEAGYAAGNEHEPIRLTTLELASGKGWDQLIRPTYSSQVQGFEYHGLSQRVLEDKPRFGDIRAQIEKMLEDRHIIIFGADFARQALLSVLASSVAHDAFCLHNKVKEYYGEFYELSLEKVLSYQGIDKKRSDLTDSRDRIQVLAKVVRNLAVGLIKQAQEPEDSNDLGDHPF